MSKRFHVNLRIALFSLGIAGILFFSWWVPLLCGIVLCARYRAFEVLALGVLTDMLWLPEVASIPCATLIALVILLGFEPLRRELDVRF